MRKKLLSILCVLSLALTLATGCAPQAGTPSASSAPQAQTPAAPVSMNVMALKGPTAMGLVQFMNEADTGKLTDNTYSFTIAAAVDEVSTSLIKGETDIAAVPANLAAVLYNNTKGGVQVLNINTLGILYMVERGQAVSSVEDLRGKTIYASGKNATPEYALNYILTQNGIDPAADVTIEWKSEHAECLAALMADENAIAMLPEPFVTTAQTKSGQIRVALDLTQAWDALQADSAQPSALITGVAVVRKEFAEQNPQAVSAFLDHYESSVQFVNTNVAQAAQLVGSYDIVPAAVAEKAIPNCNITFVEGAEMKDKLSGYLAALLEQNPKSIGGALPADDFYYSR